MVVFSPLRCCNEFLTREVEHALGRTFCLYCHRSCFFTRNFRNAAIISLYSLTAGTASIRAAPSARPREVRMAFTETRFLGAGVGFRFFFKISSDGFNQDVQKELVSIKIFQLSKFSQPSILSLLQK